MKLLFLTASAEPGRDGVGDYTRLLATALQQLGHECRVCAFRDAHSPRADEIETQNGIRTLRLGADMQWTQRSAHIQRFAHAFAPDAVSMQFVPWGFDARGIIPKDVDALAQIFRKTRRQVMLHELWLGLPRADPFKHVVLGWFQKRALLRFLRRFQPHTIHTSNATYKATLANVGIRSETLPLFGNSPLATEADIAKADAFFAEREITKNALLAGIYGSLHREWQPAPALASLLRFATEEKRPLAFIVIGRTGVNGARTVMQLRERFGKHLQIVETGALSAGHVTGIFSRLDLGVASSPWALIEKSGSAVAMLEAGLPVLVTRSDWQLRSGTTPEPTPHPRLARFTSEFSWNEFLAKRAAPEMRLPETAKAFLKSFSG